MHAPEFWSVVFPVDPLTGLILVCADDLQDHCMEVYDDGHKTGKAIDGFRYRVLEALKNRSERIAKGTVRADPWTLEPPA
ncbi:hypothetical protein [Plantactinospora mayteni]|uniref:hypothetical protein n=1 Tax=Plantactinospora mayteni TaxID=566021 RepID=UPI0019423868|nr:hypothetical protein [Plantactinospora mayteni]